MPEKYWSYKKKEMSGKKLPGIKLFDLKDRVAIITGGSKGLGLAMGQGAGISRSPYYPCQ